MTRIVRRGRVRLKFAWTDHKVRALYALNRFTQPSSFYPVVSVSIARTRAETTGEKDTEFGEKKRERIEERKDGRGTAGVAIERDK